MMSTMDERALADEIAVMKDDPDAWGDPEPTAPAGRKRSERRQRGVVLSVRLTAAEFAVVQAFARELGETLSATLRTTVLQAAARARATVTPYRPGFSVSLTGGSSSTANAHVTGDTAPRTGTSNTPLRAVG